MKVIYEAPKHLRSKKGTYKSNGKGRFPIFESLTILDSMNVENHWWCNELNEWCPLVRGYDLSSDNYNIHSLRAAIRHIKKHNEIKRGTKFLLCSRFKNTSIIIVK